MFKILGDFKHKNKINDGGCGIGLTLCKKLCDLLQIKLSFDSRKGVGTSFKLIIDLKLN